MLGPIKLVIRRQVACWLDSRQRQAGAQMFRLNLNASAPRSHSLLYSPHRHRWLVFNYQLANNRRHSGSSIAAFN